MFGLDERIVALSDGASIAIVLVAAVLLGLRHATDPDHLAAVTAVVAGGRERAAKVAARLGIAWGLGHALTLFAFGLPIVLLNEYLPAPVQQGAEVLVAVVIVVLAARLIRRWRAGRFHVHEHEHDDVLHAHVHLHAGDGAPSAHPHDHAAAHAHQHRARTPLGAFAIGLVHGMGGSAGVGVLVLATVDSTSLAIVSLVLLAVFTAVSMAILTTGLGASLATRPLRRAFGVVAPALGVVSLAFGIWYGLSALELTPYYF